jgi:hypothetical protein
VRVDIVDLHQATQFDANGKPPRPAKPAPPATGPFDFTPAPAPASPTAKYGFSLKGVSVAGGRSVPFAFSAAGTLREELGRAGFTDVTTATGGVHLPVRVNITLGAVTFTGLAATTYKARQGRTGAAVTVKPH